MVAVPARATGRVYRECWPASRALGRSETILERLQDLASDGRRALRRLWLAANLRLRHSAAFLWRRLLFRTTFIAITGSVGKTTTKELLADILAAQAPTARTYANQNDAWGVPRSVLLVRPWHRFAVIEVATAEPGQIRSKARLVKPDMAIELAVLHMHRKGFRSIDEVAADKAVLLQSLRPGGVAILNADDPHVMAMRVPDGVEVRTFGMAPGADCRASGIEAVWPDRLKMRMTLAGVECDVQTRLVGDCWTPSVLAAVLAGVAAGVHLEQAVQTICRTEPYTARLEPVELPNGAVMLRDDKGSQSPTLEPAFRVLGQARAKRRVLVVSDYSDTSHNHRDRMKYLGRDAAQCADVAIFVDTGAGHAARAAARAGMPEGDVHSFISLDDAAAFLRDELRQGDLVLLKGRISDHLARLYHAQLGSVACWKAVCRKTSLCDQCPDLGAIPTVRS